MANKNPIPDKKTPWDDYVGARVEDFLKQSLDSKIGLLYYDESNNRYMAFADKVDKDLYLSDPEAHPELLLGVFDAPFNFSAQIDLTTPGYSAIRKGSTGNFIDFTFDIKNKSGQSTGEDVVCQYTFRRGSVVTVKSERYRSGTAVHYCIDEYVQEGTNQITVGITGQQSLAATTVGVTYLVVDLSLDDTFDLSGVYRTSDESQRSFPVGFTVSGYGTKIMEWYLDGVRVPYNSLEDDITATVSTQTKLLDIGHLAGGRHTLQLRAGVSVGGEYFYTPTLYREFVTDDGSLDEVEVATAQTLPPGTVLGPDDSLVVTCEQYVTMSLRLAAFNPSGLAVTPVSVYLDDTLMAEIQTRSGEEASISFMPAEAGTHTLSLRSGDYSRNISLNVAKTSLAIAEITAALTLDLQALRKSNSSADRDSWSYGSIRASLEGFGWNETSGWTGTRLLIPNGASVAIPYAPLQYGRDSVGKTLEIEFAALNVTDDDAVICDLTEPDGTGFLLTASMARLRSAAGKTVTVRFRDGDNLRISVVINKLGGTKGGLAYIYIDGICSGAVDFAASDTFSSSAQLSVRGSAGAGVSLKSIRAYDMALTSDQIVDNFILYRDTTDEMLAAYRRNDIYEDGTDRIDPEKCMRQLPVEIITGNIPVLEATTDKKLSITVDSSYCNLESPNLDYKLFKAIMTPQGTSSMGYPKKNYRKYTTRRDDTVFINCNGDIVVDRLYAFRPDSIPVSCWCYKADYAESSGVHNTGIARLWNDLMKNAQIGGRFRLRTKAQQTAIDNGYGLDVRTAIDGFPILMFYRLSADNELVFIGKYNFNNDKSTENVFGFRDIPGFDNSNVQCWESLDNGSHLALFRDTENWAADWSKSFESRYPDGSEDTSDLKTFAEWISTVSQADFVTQKYDHFDVYKLAAYYVYVMRHGAVDQMVKNSMLTTEDGVQWFFILYDNDSVQGLRNDGPLVFGPYITRQSLDNSYDVPVYAYAGHDSKLWNLCENDEEFMNVILPEVDDALFAAGLTYENVTEMFDVRQAGKFCERIYNRDAEYKYIGPYINQGINNLYMLQGSRKSHRRWWLARRFAFLDGLWASGGYRAHVFEVKLAGAPAGLPFGIESGAQGYYGYGVNNVRKAIRVELPVGGTHTFQTDQVLNVGDPLRLYSAPSLSGIDISSFAPYLTQLNMAGVASESLGTRLKWLVLGGEAGCGVLNRSLSDISGLAAAKYLESINIRGFAAINTLDLSDKIYLQELLAADSGLVAVEFAPGAPVKRLELPATVTSLNLRKLPNLSVDELSIAGSGAYVKSLTVIDCPAVDSYRLVSEWLACKTAPDSQCSLHINGIEWEAADPEMLLRLGNMAGLQLRGHARVDSVTPEQMTGLRAVYGANCFLPGAELYIEAPDGLYIVGPDSVKGLSETVYDVVAVSSNSGQSSLVFDGSAPEGVSLEGFKLVVSDIADARQITLRAVFLPDAAGAMPIMVRKTVSVATLTYPSGASVSGPASVGKVGVHRYTVDLLPAGVEFDGVFDVNWSVSGNAVTEGYVQLNTTKGLAVDLEALTLDDSAFTVTAEVVRRSTGNVMVRASSEVQLLMPNTVISKASNPHVMAVCYKQGWAASPNYMTAAEAALVSDIGTAFERCSMTTFNEFVHFVNVNTIPNGAFSYCQSLKEITLPMEHWDATGYDTSGQSWAYYCRALKKINAPRLKTFEGTAILPSSDYVPADVVFDAPLLESINWLTPKSGVKYIIYSAGVINVPSLKSITVDGSGRPYNISVFQSYVDLPALEVFDNSKGGSDMFLIIAVR